MVLPGTRSVHRRGFIAAMAATSAAAGAFALFSQAASATHTVGQDTADETSVRRGASMNPSPQQTISSNTQEPPTVVLVHGAFADSSSWNGVVDRLLAHGYPVVAVANPLRGLKTDAEYLAGALASISGSIVLVGHSYGGAVITNAATGNGNVVALVYVAGFAPDEGETATELAGRLPGSTLGSALSSPISLPDGGADLYIRQDAFWAQFAADLPEADAKLMAATQRPVTASALDGPSGTPAWKSIPSRFIFGDLDKNIPAALQALMARRAGAHEVVEIAGASHVVMISHPHEVAEMIHQSALAHTQGRSAA
jgi:pimeloyl-ACP methyl ester carboxylesterase